MSPGAVPGSGADGGQPSRPPVPGNGRPPHSGPGKSADAGQGKSGGGGPDPDAAHADAGWDGAAKMARLVADIDAGLVAIPGEADAMPQTWFSLAGTSDPAEVDVTGFAKGGALNTREPDAVLAAVAEMAADPQVLKALTDNQVLGLAAAGRRLAARGAWVQHAAVAEFAARRAEPSPKKATPYGFTPFAPDELAPELVIKNAAAEEAMARARDAARRLPACCRLLHDGLISAFQLQIITDATACLTDDGAAEADLLLAAAAAALTPSLLRGMCTRVVMMIDPAAAQRRKDSAAKHARVIRFQEQSGNAALCGRDLPPADVLASSQHIDDCARALRAGGLPGTLDQLRALVFLDLTKGRDPLARLTTADSAEQESAGQDRAGQDSGRQDSGRQDSAGHTATVKAAITLLVPAGTLLGWSSAPGEIPGFGLLDPQTTRDLTQAAAAHPETRWCVTVVGPDGTAAAHGCAPGRHPWTPGPHATSASPDATSASLHPAPGPPPGPAPHGGQPPPAPLGQPGTPATAEQAAQVAGLLRRLRVQLAPIAQGHCDHRHYSDRYVISRKVKDLIKARATKCVAPGCNRPSATADADHTIPWPTGPSCECNIGAPCRYHHRNKQAPGWRLEQPAPGIMVWHTPSGRTHTTYPTRYVI